MENIHATQAWVTNQLEKKVNKVEGKDLSTNDYTTEEKNKLKKINLDNVSNALKETKSGEAVGITDISPIEHNMTVSVRSKNLLPFPYESKSQTKNGITLTINEDGTINVNGTATANITFVLKQNILLKKGSTYTISGCPSGGSTSTYALYIQDMGYHPGRADAGKGISITADYEKYYMWITINKGVTVNNLVFKPMLAEGTAKTEYAPYIGDISTVKLYKKGKNLLPLSFNNELPYTTNGITFDYNGDGGIKVSGTATDYASINYKNVVLVKGSTYRLAHINGLNGVNTFISYKDENGTSQLYATKTNANFTFNNTYTYLRTFLQVDKGVTVNQVIYPMLVLSTADRAEYEPYIEPTVYDVLIDGTVENDESLYPNTTLYTDTRGAVIDCTYSRDINKVAYGSTIDTEARSDIAQLQIELNKKADKEDIVNVYEYYGSVNTFNDLPTEYESIPNGAVYNVLDTEMNYAWNGIEWDPLGGEHKDIEARTEIDLLKSYGTTDVYVLQPGIDITIKGSTVTGFLRCNFSDYEKIAFPEGITTIRINEDFPEPFIANTIYMPKSLKVINNFLIDYVDPSTYEGEYFNVEKCVLNEGLEEINNLFDNGKIKYINLPESLKIMQENFAGISDLVELEFPKNITKVPNGFAAYSSIERIILGTHVTSQEGDTAMFADANVTIYGYAGSFAEELAKKYNIPFVNMGSDYSTPINSSTATEATIKPNEYYTFDGVFDETGNEVTPLSSLTVTLDTASITKLDEFMFSFTTPSDISTFSFGVLTDKSVEIKWVKEPNLKPDYIYEVSVVNGVGVIAGTAKEVV
jgi:hypothetical protein